MKICLPLLALSAFLCGCAAPNPADIKPIQSVYASQLAQMKTGMSLGEFKAIFPCAYPAAQNGATTAYEVSLRQVIYDRRRPGDAALGFYTPENLVDDQRLWFYFYEDGLVQWGRPQDWPQHP